MSATTTLDEVEGAGHRIVGVELAARAHVPGMEREAFERAARAADEGCPFSALVKASATVSIVADLEDA